MIQDMPERLKKAIERQNCRADEEIVSLRAALAAKDAEIERLKRFSRHPDDIIMLNQQQTKIIEQEQRISAKDAEIERLKACRADAALGRAVRKMPAWTFLYQNSVGWFYGTEMSHGTRTYGPKADTPEAALEAAGLMEVEK